MKIENFIGDNGNAIANQFKIITKDGCFFQSYQTIIAKISKGEVTLDPNYNCSRTTTKYLRAFLGEGIAETRKKIESKEYTIKNLNK